MKQQLKAWLAARKEIRDSSADSFWHGGYNAYQRGLEEQYDGQIQKLKSRINAESDPDRKSVLTQQLANLDREYSDKYKFAENHIY
jgi:hypothetical protein